MRRRGHRPGEARRSVAASSRPPAPTPSRCVPSTNCRYAYSSGERDTFSIFNLRKLSKPREIDSNPKTNGDPALQLAHRRAQVELRRRRLRHPHRVRRLVDLRRQQPAQARGWSPPPVTPAASTPTSPARRATTTSSTTTPSAPTPRPFKAGRGAVVRQRQRAAGDRGGLRPDRLHARRFVPDLARQAAQPSRRVGDQAARQGGARPTSRSSRTWPCRSRRAPSAPPTGSTTTPAASSRSATTAAAPSSSTSATRRNIKSYGYAYLGASEVWDAMWVPEYDGRRRPDRREDQRRLLDRPGPGHQRATPSTCPARRSGSSRPGRPPRSGASVTWRQPAPFPPDWWRARWASRSPYAGAPGGTSPEVEVRRRPGA